MTEEQYQHRNLRVLVVDDDALMCRTLEDILVAKGYMVETALSAEDGLEKLSEASFDCILSDIRMPGINGVEMHRRVKSQHPDLPMVLMTAYAADLLVAERDDFVAVLDKPIEFEPLFEFFTFLQEEPHIIIVDDDPMFCRTLQESLMVEAFNKIDVVEPSAILDALNLDNVSQEKQILLLDLKLEELTGADVLRTIRTVYPTLPVVLVTGYREEMAKEVELSLQMDAYTCLDKPFHIEELLSVLSTIQNRETERFLANTFDVWR